MSIATPVVPLFAKSFGVSFGAASLVVTMSGVGRIFADIPIGLLVDRVGRRPMVVVGALLTASSALASGFAQSFFELLVYRTLSGIGMAMWEGARQTIIADAVPLQMRGRITSGFMAVVMLGVTVGPVVGGIVASIWGLRGPFFLHAVVGLVSTLLSYALVKETRLKPCQPSGGDAEESSSRTAFRSLFTYPVLLAFGFATFANHARLAARNVVIPFLGTNVLNVGTTEVGVLLTLIAAGNMLLAIPAGVIMDRFGRKKTLVPGLVITGLAYMLYGGVGDYVQAIYVSILMGFGTGVGAGVVGTMSADMAPKNARGFFIGVWRMMGDFGGAGGPLIVGVVMDVFGVRAAFLAMAVVLLVASVTTQLFVKETFK